MRAEIDGESTPDEWDRLAVGLGGGCFHSDAGAKVEAALGGEPLRIRFVHGGATVGAVTGAVTRTRSRLLGRWRDRISLGTAPLLAAGTDPSLLGPALLELGRRLRVKTIAVETYDAPGYLLDGRTIIGGPRQDSRVEFRLALSPDWESVLAAMSPGHRRNLRKAQKMGLDVRRLTGFASAQIIRDLQEGTFDRRKALGHHHAHQMDAATYERVLRIWMSRGGESWVAYRQDEPVSGIVITRLGDRSYYLVGGTSRAGFACHAPFAVFGEVLATLGKDGCRELNLGGVPKAAEESAHPDHGLFRFKRDFGAKTLALHSETVRL